MILRITEEIRMTLYKIIRVLHTLTVYLTIFIIIMYYGLIALRLCAFFTGKRKEFGYIGKKHWSKALFWVAGLRVEKEGLQNISPGQNYLFAPNHTSLLDFVMLSGAIPVRFVFVGSNELYNIPFLGPWARFAGDLKISRRDPVQALREVQDLITKLKNGETMVFFAEGTRSWDGKLTPFKNGLGVLAGESGIPVIPVAIIGSFEALPRTRFYHRPGTIRVKYGEPIRFSADESPILIAAKIHDKVAELLKE
jgi:1-acyl-sn-glycerol-3-phosphate acyltransferase